MQQTVKLCTRFLLLAFLFLSNLTLFAGETGKIAGVITDKETNEPVAGANVIINKIWLDDVEVTMGRPMGAATDLDGIYYIINIPPGIYNIQVSFVSYVDEVRTKVQIFVDKTTTLDFEITPVVLTTETIVVSAYRPAEVEKDLTATKTTYDMNSLQTIAGMNNVTDVLSLQADVVGDHFRGGRSGEAIYLVGGASIVNPLNNQRSFDPITTGLEQVEVYTSGFSAEYGNVQSGVVNMIPKEGKDQWRTRLEIASTNSYYKTQGGSIYSTENLTFYSKFVDANEWLDGVDPVSGRILWQHFGIDFPSNYLPPPPITFPLPPPLTREDSLRTANLIRTMWLQGMSSMGYEYDKPDYRIDFAGGGPIFKNTSIFVAARQNFVNPIFPSAEPNTQTQLLSNLTYHLSRRDKLRLTFNYDKEKINDFTSNFFNWFEDATRNTINRRTTFQFGLDWNHVFGNSSFLDLRINQLNTLDEDRVFLLRPDQYSNDYSSNTNWRFYTIPSGYTVGGMNTTYGDAKTKSFNFNGNFTSQVTLNHMIKTGIQFTYHDIDVDRKLGMTNTATMRFDEYHEYPYEGAIYIQDKMEFEGIIANVGLRFDFYNFNTSFYSNKFSPYRNPGFDPTNPESGQFYDQNNAGTEETGLNTVLQPRIGISFPVSESTVLHLNYGVFTQRPAYEYIFVSRFMMEANPNFERLGNPALQPERTNAYDVGLVQSFPLGFRLDLSAYLKDVSNLVQMASYTDRDGFVYETFDNREYADIYGFQISLERSYGLLRGFIRYNWESSTGKSSSAVGSADRVKYYEGEPERSELKSPEDIYLDYNRLHKLVTSVIFVTPYDYGPELIGFKLFSDFSTTVTYEYLSGRPFTWDETGQGLRFNQRSPVENDLSMRIEKRFRIGLTTLSIYLEGFNILNDEVFSYGRTFSDDPNNPYRQRYMDQSQDVLVETEFSPYTSRLNNYLYTNQPRHWRFGIIYKF
jgi:outer membrane receptor protein involved in Fe transport